MRLMRTSERTRPGLSFFTGYSGIVRAHFDALNAVFRAPQSVTSTTGTSMFLASLDCAAHRDPVRLASSRRARPRRPVASRISMTPARRPQLQSRCTVHPQTIPQRLADSFIVVCYKKPFLEMFH